MLKVYSKKYYASIDGGEWLQLYSNSYPYVLHDDGEPTTCNIFDNITFEECYEWLQKHHSCGIRWERTLFGKKKIIRLKYNWNWDDDYVYKNFKTISYKYVLKECSYVTLDEILKHFPADQCIQYMKERGITACPMIGGDNG